MAHFDARWQRPETLQAIFDQISDSVLFFDKNLHLVRVNKSGEQLFGLPAGKMIGKPCWELFGFAAGEPNQGFNPKAVPAVAGPAWFLPTGVVRLRMDHNVERRVIIRTIELHDQAGALEVVVATVTDITDRSDLAEAHAEPVYSAPPSSSPKYHPVVIRNRRVAAVAGGLLLIFLVFIAVKLLTPPKPLTAAALADKEKREAAARFSAMTPAQHIERAKSALRSGTTSDAIADGLRHLKVIPATAPEASRAKALQQDLVKAANLASAQSLIDASANAGVRDGLDKLQRASVLLDTVTTQYPNDNDAAQVSRAVQGATEGLALRYPEDFASAETELVEFTWEKGGFGTVMMANFTIRNNSPVDVGDLKIRCEHYADSGVVLDDNTGTVFGIVKAHSTRKISNVNMGFLNAPVSTSRTKKTECQILTLKLASESQAFTSSR